MITTLFNNIKQRIRKASLYWKTWAITTITILVTIGLFFLIFSSFAAKFLERSQQNKFNQSANLIADSIHRGGINPTFLDKYSVEGYSITITLDNKIVYPIHSDIIVESWPTTDLDIGTKIIINETPNLAPKNSMILTQSVSNQGDNYKLDIFYPIAVNQEEIMSVLHSIAPYFVIIGLFVSFIISFLYARYFSQKVTHLNQTVHEMSTSSASLEYDIIEGDELQDLENSLHRMYQKLQHTLEKLNQEMGTVKRLEEDRQIFMRSATHELKTPIMAMTTMLEGMMGEVEGYEDHEHYLQACYARLQSMSRLVNEMLEIARMESVVFSGETELNETTEEVLAIYDYMIQDKEINLNIKQLENNNIHIPKRNLQKVLSNLIGNAVKYTPNNGNINIHSDKYQWSIHNQITNSTLLKDKNIFAPFVTVETECNNDFEKSHGLGLYIVETILKQYDYHYHWEIDENKQEFVFIIQLSPLEKH